MKKVMIIVALIAGIAFTAFKNSENMKVKNLPVEKPKAMIPSGSEYAVNTEKSIFTWTGKKVTGEHTGNVKIASGKIYLKKGLPAGGEIEMDMNSISESEGSERLVGHLKSEDFFDVANHPKASFTAKIFAIIKDAKEGEANYYVKGDITIKGITKEITIPATIKITDIEITATADFNIDRTDFGIKYKSNKYDPGIGDKFIYDEFNLKINFVAAVK